MGAEGRALTSWTPGEGTWREDGTPGGVAKGIEAASFDGRGSGYEGEAQEW